MVASNMIDLEDSMADFDGVIHAEKAVKTFSLTGF